MKHALFAMVVGLALVTGCAAGVDDEIPPAPTPSNQQGISRATPNEPLNAPFNDPNKSLTTTRDHIDIPNNLPAWQVPAPHPGE